MRRRTLLATLMTAPAGCAPTAEQQAAALSPVGTVESTRLRQSRRFDTADRPLMLRATVATLQDLGFSIDESQAEFGIIVGSKLAGGRIRAQVVLRSLQDQKTIVVRATFQRIIPRPGAILAEGRELNDPELYRGFFEKLAQSTFLTAHEI